MNRRAFLLGLGSLTALTAAPAYAQVWRKVCLASELASCSMYQLPPPLPPSAGRGYFGGGSSTTEIDGIRFDTEAVINPAAVLAAARGNLAGVNSATRGYFGGGSRLAADGWTTNLFSEIDGIRFDTEAAVNPAAALAAARASLAGVNSATRGYFGGGGYWDWWGMVCNAEIDGIRFDTEAAINPAAALAAARVSLAGVNSATRGYFGGGMLASWAPCTEIDGIRFDTEAAINPAATLAVARYGVVGVNSATRGYFGGGVDGGVGAPYEIDGIDFASETATNPLASMARAMDTHAGVNSAVCGYFACDYGEVVGIRFDVEAGVNPSTTLVTSRRGSAGVQSGAL